MADPTVPAVNGEGADGLNVHVMYHVDKSVFGGDEGTNPLVVEGFLVSDRAAAFVEQQYGVVGVDHRHVPSDVVG